jgi:uncharacterized Zn finger protein
MDEPTSRVAVPCPACSPDRETVHEILKSGGQSTIRCTECSHVHKEQLPEEQTIETEVVISQDGESFATSADVPAEETLAVGEEFLAETEEAIMTVRITSLELADGRHDEATAEDVQTIWTRAVGNVSVDVTAHPKSGGAHDETRSFSLQVPGDYEFVVDETDDLGGEEFTVEGIYLREDASGYEFDKLDFAGDSAVAKDIKRLYVRDETSTAWSAW